MRTFLAALAFAAFAAAPTYAISVNGSDADWVAAGLLHTTNIRPRRVMPRWWPMAQRFRRHVLRYCGGSSTQTYDKAYPQVWMNVDNSVATYCGNPDGIVAGKGFDVDLEMDVNDPGEWIPVQFLGL